MLEAYDVAGAGFYDPRLTHVTLEAKKLVYEDRANFYADMGMADVPLAGLLDPAYAASRRALIDEERAATEITHGDPSLERGDTVYFTVADDDGHVVSWIQSNYTGFGSGVVPAERGFTLQNRGNLFHLDENHRNAFAPGKRPFHTIIPAMMTKDGAPVLSFGVMGGAMQPQGHAQIVINMVDHGMNVQEAGDAPRWRHNGSSEPTGAARRGSGTVNVESGVPDATVEWLRNAGHEVRVKSGGYGGYQGIWIDHIGDPAKRVYRGGSESRKDGMAIGF
jgi:gamma-glutamyltranspeptidase/glutathione hydrolase